MERDSCYESRGSCQLHLLLVVLGCEGVLPLSDVERRTRALPESCQGDTHQHCRRRRPGQRPAIHRHGTTGIVFNGGTAGGSVCRSVRGRIRGRTRHNLHDGCLGGSRHIGTARGSISLDRDALGGLRNKGRVVKGRLAGRSNGIQDRRGINQCHVVSTETARVECWRCTRTRTKRRVLLNLRTGCQVTPSDKQGIATSLRRKGDFLSFIDIKGPSIAHGTEYVFRIRRTPAI